MANISHTHVLKKKGVSIKRLCYTLKLLITSARRKKQKRASPEAIPVVFIGVAPWHDATIAMLSENARCAFYGRGMPRPYKSHYLSFTTVIVFVVPLSAVRRKR